MNAAIVEARIRQEVVKLSRCRVLFPGEEIDFPFLHNAEFATNLRDSEPRAYDTLVRRSIDEDRLH